MRFFVTQQIPITDGIEAGRVMLRRSYIDKEACAAGLACLEQYRMQWDDKRQAFHKNPLHDWTSHGVDALRTGAVGLLPQMQPLPDPITPGSFAHARKNVQRARRGLPVRTFRVGGG